VHKVEADIRKWSSDFLELPNVNFNGLPPCPYAKKAFLDRQVVFNINTGIDGLVNAVKDYDTHEYDIVVWADEDPPEMEYLDGFCDGVNESLSILGRDMHLMVFHPDYSAEDMGLDILDDGGVTDPDLYYAMVFIQRLSLLDDASIQLERKGYYENFPKDVYQSLVLERRRLRHGNEGNKISN